MNLFIQIDSKKTLNLLPRNKNSSPDLETSADSVRKTWLYYSWLFLSLKTRLFCPKKLNVNSRINSKLIWLKRRHLTSYFWRHTSRQKFESTSQIWKKIFKSWISEAWSRDFWTDSAKNQKQNVEFLEKFQRRKWGSESVRWNSLNLLFRKRNFVKMDCSINVLVTSKIELF